MLGRLSKEVLVHKPVSSIEPCQSTAPESAKNIFVRRLLLGVTVISEYLNRARDATSLAAPVSPRLGVDLGEYSITKAFCQKPKRLTQQSSTQILAESFQDNQFASHKSRRKSRRNKGYGNCWPCKIGQMHQCWRKLASDYQNSTKLPTVDPIKDMYRKKRYLGLKTSVL